MGASRGQLLSSFCSVDTDLLREAGVVGDDRVHRAEQVSLAPRRSSPREDDARISEVAAAAGVSTRALRHYEQQELITSIRTADGNVATRRTP